MHRAVAGVCVLLLGVALCAATGTGADARTAARADEILAELGIGPAARPQGPSATELESAARSLPTRVGVKSDEAAIAEDAVDPVTGEALLEEHAQMRHAQRLQSERAQTEAAIAQQTLAAASARQQYIVHGRSLPMELSDPCIALCDHDGGWRDFACQDCIFQGMVNGYVARYHHFHAHLNGYRSYDYNAWSREYCSAAQHRHGGQLAFSKCFLDQIMASCNL